MDEESDVCGTALGVRALAAAGAALAVLAACTGDSGDADGSEGAGPLIVGTTEVFATVDPAGTYDRAGWWLLSNVGQTLLTVPPGQTQPVPDLAEECEFTEPTTYECTLVSGALFSDGSPLTSKDVKHTFDRMAEIAHDDGPASLYETLENVETPDDRTVVFTLGSEDATWPQKLATAGATIVPRSFPGDELQPDDPKQLVLSGPYRIARYNPSRRIVLEPNPNYTGHERLANDRVVLRPYETERALKQAVEQGEVHVAHRSLSPAAVNDLARNGEEHGVRVVTGAGSEISYLAFATSREPFDRKEVRQAVAALLDRRSIARTAYDTVRPLYTMVPEGLEGHVPAFREYYGKGANVEQATQLLQQAGVEVPVETTLWYQPERYGAASAEMYAEIERQLEESELFQVELKSTGWEAYQKAYRNGKYDAFQLGWSPDYPDADNYLAPVYATNNAIGDGYGFSNDVADQLLEEERATEALENRVPIFGELQYLGADEVPAIPLWQAAQVAAVRHGVSGVRDTFDLTGIFRLWLVAPPAG